MDICVADAERGRGIVEACGAKDYQFADRGEDLDSLWEARRGCYMAAMTYREVKGDRVYVLDPSYYTLYTPFIYPLYTCERGPCVRRTAMCDDTASYYIVHPVVYTLYTPL